MGGAPRNPPVGRPFLRFHVSTLPVMIRPISLLTLSLLTLLDSNSPGNPLLAWKFHPFKLRLCASPTP